MDRTISTWHSRVVVIAVLIAIIAVVGVGMGAVAGETTTTESPEINQTNNPDDIYTGEGSHEIENIDVQYSSDYGYNVTNMYVNLSELQNNGVNVTSTVISNIKVEHGSVSEISKIENSGQAVFKIKVKHRNSPQGFSVASLEFEGLRHVRCTNGF